jgi:hypothetical protein
MVLKVLLQILTGLISIFLISLDYYFSDKNSQSFKLTRAIATGLTLLIMVCGAIAIAYDDFSQEQNTKNLNSEISLLKDGLNNARDSVGTLVKISGKVITDTLNKVKDQQNKIQESLKPFLKIAQASFITRNGSTKTAI